MRLLLLLCYAHARNRIESQVSASEGTFSQMVCNDLRSNCGLRGLSHNNPIGH